MTWQDILKARRRSLQKVPIAGSPVRGSHGYAGARSRGSKRQQERKEILDPELDALDEEEPTYQIWYYTIHKHGYDEFNEEPGKRRSGTLEEVISFAEADSDSYDIDASTHPLYGGIGFYIEDENKNVVYDSGEDGD